MIQDLLVLIFGKELCVILGLIGFAILAFKGICHAIRFEEEIKNRK